jgi:hypothetical protein
VDGVVYRLELGVGDVWTTWYTGWNCSNRYITQLTTPVPLYCSNNITLKMAAVAAGKNIANKVHHNTEIHSSTYLYIMYCCFVFGNSQDESSVRTPGTATEAFGSFPQPLNTNVTTYQILTPPNIPSTSLLHHY